MNDDSGVSNPDHALSYYRSDFEFKFGIRNSKYTQVSSSLSGILALGLTAILFGGLYPFKPTWADILLARGLVPYGIAFFSLWSVVILLIKASKLRLQKRVLLFPLIPKETDFVISTDTVSVIHDRIHSLVDAPLRFTLYKRILTGINSIRNLGRISDVGEVIRAQAEVDESACETSYSLVRGFLWGIPVLGFIGTVLGLSNAIGGFGEVLSSSKDISSITTSLKGVTAGLSVAFDTTLLSLICAFIIQILMTFLKKREEEFLDSCSDFCQHHIIDRIKVTSGTHSE